MTLVVSFTDSKSGLVSLVGGKGSNLIALTSAGYPVPPGFIVTAESYRLFLEGITWLDQELDQFAYDRP